MSAEPVKRCAYSADIRWRIVYQRIGMNLGYEKIARNLNVSVSTAYRIYHLFLSTDSANPKPPRKRPEVRTLSPSLEIYVISVVMANPSKFLFEICSEIKEFFDIVVCPSIVCRLLKVHGLTRKKIQQVALQRCDKLRGAFMSQCFFFHPDKFVFLDETGCDHRSHVRKYGYALRGLTPVSSRILARGKRINAISAICTAGLVSAEYTSENVNGECIFDFVRSSIIPNMLPFDGANARSILIMDNASVHHITELVELLRQAEIHIGYT